MRTPVSACPSCPKGLDDGRGKPFCLPFDLLFALRAAASFTTLRDDFFVAAFALFCFFLAISTPPSFPLIPHHGHPNIQMIYFLQSAFCGLRLPMRPLSLPAAGSITALMSVGLPESIAAFTARLSSSGLVALMPTPPKA